MPSSELATIRFDRALAVERVGEAVGLVADTLQHEQRLAPPRDLDGSDAAGQEDLLEPLGEAGDRDLVGQPERLDHPLGDAELALAAVDEQQLRRVGELAPGLSPTLADRAVALVEVGREPAASAPPPSPRSRRCRARP